MNIQPINSDYNNVSMKGYSWKQIKNKVAQKILDTFPEHTFKESAKRRAQWEKIDNFISRPAENRLIMGATAICTQPLIDANNHKVDKETRRVSRNRTIAKIIAGTSVGILVRATIYQATQSMTELANSSKHSKTLLPKKFLKELSETAKFLKNYRSALSMGIALLAMCFTNFILDAPLTVWLTNELNEKTEVKHE